MGTMKDQALSPTESRSSLDNGETASVPKSKKPRTTTACDRCRRKRGRCDGAKPVCGPCSSASVLCEYDLGGDKRKPFTKSVVSAMQLRIDTLQAQLDAANAALANARGDTTSLPANPSTSATPIVPSANGARPTVLDAFQGGLALNAHGELRFYGPTSSYRSALADSTSQLGDESTVEAIRAFSLTRAPIPTAAPAEPMLPRRPPELAPEFKAKLLKFAFDYCFSHYNIVPMRPFLADMHAFPHERTQNYSPFLLNVILAVGCRYLDPTEDMPDEICGLVGEWDTRGDVYITYGRYLLDQEWYNPTLSTIRGLLVLSLYLACRGYDGPSSMFMALALKLNEDFGLHLGMHRLAVGGANIPTEVITSRSDTFWATFCSDLISSMYIGRKVTFVAEEIDVPLPPIIPELDFEEPMYRSSAFHWAAKLSFIANKIMTSVYSLKPGLTLAQRQRMVPELHLQLESWYHELPSMLRASTTDPTKAPHPHIIALNMTYACFHICLHRPFFRRHSKDATTNISTEKCLSAAAQIVRLIKLLRNSSSGLEVAAPGVQHAAFCCGTILAISSVESGISDNPRQDAERRIQARKDLRTVTNALHTIGRTWTTAHTSAAVLEALMSQWGEGAAILAATSSASSSIAQAPIVPATPSLPPKIDLDQALVDVSMLPAPPIVELDQLLSPPSLPNFAPSHFDQGAPIVEAAFQNIFPLWNLDDNDAAFDFMTLLQPLPDSILGSPVQSPESSQGPASV